MLQILFTAVFELAKTIYDTSIGDCPKKTTVRLSKPYLRRLDIICSGSKAAINSSFPCSVKGNVGKRGGCGPNSQIGSTVSVIVRAAHAHTLL